MMDQQDKESSEENVMKDLYRKHSSGDLHSRLKTRKILGVGETDNGDIHRSKISQLLGHNEHLYVRFPRGYWVWHLTIALTFTVMGLNNLFLPRSGWSVGLVGGSADSSYLACRYYGCTSLALAFMLWLFWGTSDKGVAKTLLIVTAICHGLQVIAVILDQWDESWSWYFYISSTIRMLSVMPNVYFYRGIGHCGLRLRKSNSFGNLKDCTFNNSSGGSLKKAN